MTRGPRRFAQVALLVVLLAAAAEARCGGGEGGGGLPNGAQACGPFGNPPATLMADVRPRCFGGKLLGPWADSDGTLRYACVFEPRSSAPGTRLPLVVYLHPSLFPAGSVYLTNLLKYQETAKLGSDGSKPGFILLAPQGRKTTHYYPVPDHWGIGWDNWYRQFNPAGDVTVGGASFRQNVDAAAIDHFVAQEVAAGKADPDRIYLTGWSNGAAMAILYGLSRPNVAAAAVYSAPNPFGAFSDPCPQKPVATAPANAGEIQLFNPGLPIMHIHNNCDAAGLCPSAEQLADELRPPGVPIQDSIINSLMTQVGGCLDWCGTNPNGDPSLIGNPLGATLGLLNHGRWPFGWTPAMLDFFRQHPLSARSTKK